jgi:hypothetical protein
LTVPDTPDYQHGVVAAQELLGQIAGGDSGTFTIPANAQGLIVHAPGGSVETLTSVVGTTTGAYYPFTAIPVAEGSSAGPLYAVFVVPALDDAVTITVSDSSDPWYVVADTGTGTGSVVAPVTPPGAYNLSQAFAALDLDLPYPGPDLNSLALTVTTYQPAYDNEEPDPPNIKIVSPPIAFAPGTGITADTAVTLTGLSTLATSGMNLQMAVFMFDTAGENAIYLLGTVAIPAGTVGPVSITMDELAPEQSAGGDLTFDSGDGSLVTAAGGVYTCVLMMFGSV